MISVEKAREKLLNSFRRLGAVNVNVANSPGFILAKDIHSPLDLPGFDNSAMDGYALRSRDIETRKTLDVIGEVRAGDKPAFRVKKGQAGRINTGAAIPHGADSVLIKEEAVEKGGKLYAGLSAGLRKCVNIRKRGSELRIGDLVFRAGTLTTARVIGCLSSMGLARVTVYRKPKVSVIVTGTELIAPGKRLKPGQIYDSNSDSLLSLLGESAIREVRTRRLKDNEHEIKRAFAGELHRSDVIIFCGGMSAGGYDYVIKILNESKVRQIFYKIAQKPGKPFYAGIYRNKLIFGLPGNPAASMICYYEYIYPALRKLQGYSDEALELVHSRVPLLNTVKLPEGRASFLKGKLLKGGVLILNGQESHKLTSLAEADCLVYVPERTRRLIPGKLADIHLLNY